MSRLATKKKEPRIDKALISAIAEGKTKPNKVRSKKTVYREAEEAAKAYTKRVQRCEACGYAAHDCPPRRCSATFERAHLIGRIEQYIQFRPDNVCCLCNGHHKYFTNHPDAWTHFVKKKWPARWDHLNDILKDHRAATKKEPLVDVYAACEAWYKAGGKIEDWPYEPLCPTFVEPVAPDEWLEAA